MRNWRVIAWLVLALVTFVLLLFGRSMFQQHYPHVLIAMLVVTASFFLISLLVEKIGRRNIDKKMKDVEKVMGRDHMNN